MDDIKKFEAQLKSEILKQGGTEEDINLISIELIENAIKNGRTHEDVAWAIIQ